MPRPALLLILLALAACARATPPATSPDAAGATAATTAATVPDSFVVAFETTEGRFDVIVRRSWSPEGAARIHQLVREGFFDGARFFRVVPGFVVQFGLPADPAVAERWRERRIGDEPVKASNWRGTLSFARGGPNSRSTQLFINLRDNARLDSLNTFGFPPVGEVLLGGMAVVDSLYGEYGEAGPRGRGPSQDSIRVRGEPYLAAGWPELDAIRTARIVRSWPR